MRYQDFVVQIGLLPGGQLQARVLRSPAGEGEGSQALPRSLAELAFSPFGCDPLQPDDDSPSRNLVRRAAPPKNAGEVGRDLHDLLFAGTVGRLWEQSLGSLRGRPDEGLRLRLQFDLAASAGLGELPWELLFRADTASYLSLDRQTPVLRHLEVAQPVLPQPLPPSLKVVGVASSPSEMATLDLATEKQELESQRRKRRRWQVSFLAKPTIEALRRTLVEQGSHVLHFMGHGGFDSESGEGVLYFVDDQGRVAPWTGHALAAKLAGVSSLRLVVLNACETAVSGAKGTYGGVAAALVRSGIPAVVAMQRPISDAAAIAYSNAFYSRLANGASLEEAMTEGRQAIHTLNPDRLEWAVPVLFGRSTESLFAPLAGSTSRGQRLLAVTLGAGLLLALGVAQVRGWMTGPLPTHAIEVDRILATGVEGLEAKLASVEILADGRIRLHLAVENRSAKARLLGFDFSKSYVADEKGNAYAVKSTSSPVKGADSLIETIPAGESRRYWVEVGAPQDQARRLHVELANPERSEASFPPFEVALPTYPKELSVPSPTPPDLEDAAVLPLEVQIDSGRKDVFSQLRRLEVSEKGMRLSFDLWNRGTQQLAADFDPAAIELRDGLGHVLKPTRMGIFEGGTFVDLTVDSVLRRAVRSRIFLEFPPPVAITEKFELQLATRPNSEFHFAKTTLKVAGAVFERVRKSLEDFARKATPKLEVRRQDQAPVVAEAAKPQPTLSPPAPLPVPEARFEVAPGEQELRTSRDQLKGKIKAVQRLSNGRLRFLLELTNLGEEQLEIALRLDGTKLADGDGRQFRLLASSFGEAGEGGPGAVRFPLGIHATRELYFEFSGRVSGAELFTFVLGSADPENCRFLPLRMRLPPE